MFFICDKDSRGKYGVKDTTDGVVEYYTKAQLVKLHQSSKVKILGMRYNYMKKEYSFKVLSIASYIDSFNTLLSYDFLPRLSREISYDSYDVRISEEDLMLEVRFLGGFSAWSGDEDICDADILDMSVRRDVSNLIKEFEKKIGLKVDFTTGEKAWSYFYFS